MTPVFLIILDISGYTKFLRRHHNNIRHAEMIVVELLEALIKTAIPPLELYEVSGDAVTFYVRSTGSPIDAQTILQQVNQCFLAFARAQEAIRKRPDVARCEACQSTGRLKLKAILHFGTALFTTVGGFTKIAGPDVIIAHRLLKNSIPEDEYILMTPSFYEALGEVELPNAVWRSEQCEGFEDLAILVSPPEESAVPASEPAPECSPASSQMDDRAACMQEWTQAA